MRIVGNLSNQIDAFKSRDDVQRFKEVAGSILASTAAVCAVALVIFNAIAAGAAIVAGITLGCLFSAGTVSVISVAIAFLMATCLGAGAACSLVVIPELIKYAKAQCEETHDLIWNN